MTHYDDQLKNLMDLLILYHESYYLINQQKAEDGLNGLIDLLNDYQEAIQLMIESNREKKVVKDIN